MELRLEQRLAGWSLIAGAALFWLSWYLMPQPGSTDAAFILAAVAAQRGNVLASAVVQTLAAVAFVPPALLIVRVRGSRLLYPGAALLLVGAIGNGADAVYHQLAYEMTAPGVVVSAVAPVMARMQTVDIRLLVPLMLAFLAGAICLAVGMGRAKLAPARLWLLFVLAALFGMVGRLGLVSARPVSLAVLGLITVVLGWVGWGLRRAAVVG